MHGIRIVGLRVGSGQGLLIFRKRSEGPVQAGLFLPQWARYGRGWHTHEGMT